MLSLEQLQNILDGSWRIKPRPKPAVICINHDQRRANFSNENYTILTLDIIEESNRQELNQIWNEIFPKETEITFSEDQCPMIFAIDRQVSIRTHPPQFFYRSNRIHSMDELKMFKEEFDRNEKYFESKFFRNIVCCQDLVVMLCEYLPLNDIISTFTLDILQELEYRRMKLFIEYPTDKITSNHIVSVRIQAAEWRKTFESSTNVVFPSVKTLIIEDFNARRQFSSCSIKNCFPILNYLIFESVNNRSIDMRRFSSLFSNFPPTLTHFKICGSTVRCSHDEHRPLFSIPTTFNQHIQSFQLNLSETSHSNDNQCLQFLENCIFNTLTDFIRIMQQIRHVQLILPTNLIQPLIVLQEYCPNLNKIIIKMLGDFLDLDLSLCELLSDRSARILQAVLIYIYHNRKFSISDYFLENYIVYSLNIIHHEQFWQRNFPNYPFHFSLDKCPMLFGINREIKYKNNRFIFTHRPNLLFEKNENLIKLQDKSFLTEFHRNEQYFKSKFVQATFFSPDILIQLLEYLSLNDAVEIFSPEILVFLSKNDKKLPIIDPNEHFLSTTMQNIKPDKINALHLQAYKYKQTLKKIPNRQFRFVQSLIIEELYDNLQIPDLKNHFPSLISCTFHFNDEINIRRLCRLPNLLPKTLERFQIRCSTLSCSHDRFKYLYMESTFPNQNIQIFVLHLFEFSQSNHDSCFQMLDKCQLRTILDFIRIMIYIQRIQLIIYEDNLDVLLDVCQWIQLVEYCQRLNRITIKVKAKNTCDLSIVNRIQHELKSVRNQINFQVKTNLF